MSFMAGRGVNILAAVTTAYRIDHPKLTDANTGNVDTRKPRHKFVEIVNVTTGLVYIAFDRTAVAPAGNGVQGGYINATNSALGGPYAATPGDFDICLSGSSWPAVDINIPVGSEFMSVLSVAAGSITVTYGGSLD